MKRLATRIRLLLTNAEKHFRFWHFLGMSRCLESLRSAVEPVTRPVLACLLVAFWLPGTEAPAADEGGELDLVGSWHVTVHYRDEASAIPEAERWDDKVWRFERRGSRLQWTEFPIVLFENREGRFEVGDGDRPVRVLHFWEPNEAQQAEIEKGLRVDPQGAKAKGMRGSSSRGYRSAGGLRSESSSVIGYSESWSVEGLAGKPVFTQSVVMGSGRSEDMEGRTRYAAEVVSTEGNWVRGHFVRDGTRRGVFVLRRTGDAILLGSGPDAK